MPPTIVTSLEAFRQAAAEAPARARIPVEAQVTVPDPFQAYRRARTTEGVGAYLATTGGQSGRGYFGVEPVTVHESGPAGSALAALAAVLDDEQLHRGPCELPYPCGAIGWLSYDVAREIEQLPATARRDRSLPRLQLAVYGTLATWREPRPRNGDTTLRITACPPVETTTSEAIETAYNTGRDHALALAERATTGDPAVGGPPATGAAEFESDAGRAAFTDRVQRAQSYIRDGDTFQANISHRLRADATVHPVAAYDALRTVNPAPYSALLEFPGVDMVSASPELLLERAGSRLVTEPIAGTRPRSGADQADARLERDLLMDEKERAEHAMLVDLERNDLGKVCSFGSVTVDEYRRIDRYAEVMHLVSEITGRLRPDAGLQEAIAAVFPGGTITGAPKPRTMAIIDELEPTRRGPYTGSIGLFGFDGQAIMNIIIRTLVRYEDEYHLRVGAGVVHDSAPDSEYEETLDKARALVQALDHALGERGELRVR